jgi:hypothetical protein
MVSKKNKTILITYKIVNEGTCTVKIGVHFYVKHSGVYKQMSDAVATKLKATVSSSRESIKVDSERIGQH